MKTIPICWIAACSLCLVLTCKKEKIILPAPPGPVDTAVVVKPPVDPPIASTIGFFLDDWSEKVFTVPAYKDTTVANVPGTIIQVDPSSVITKVPLSIFGNNANPYMGQMVTEPLLLQHIRSLRPHIIRFPGGNLSSLYFWNAQRGNVPPTVPPTLLNAQGVEEKGNYWYGRNNESWTISLDNYYSMLQQTGNTGMITINYGYARYGTGADPVADAAHLAADWVRYDNGRTRYWEIGNESNGEWQAGYRIDVANNKDGQPALVTGALYGKHFRVIADSMKKAAAETGKTIFIGAQLLEKPADPWQTATDKGWNEGVFKEGGNIPDYYIVHSYFTPYNTNSNAASILASAGTVSKNVMDYLVRSMQAAGVTQKPIALTEWNIFAQGSRQMASYVNGMHATLVLGSLLQNKYGMASRWNLANGWDNGDDHGTFNAGDEPGGVQKWNPRPVFYYMYFFQKFLGDRLVSSTVVNNPNIEAFASSFSSGQAGVVLVNKATSVQHVQLELKNYHTGNRYYWYTLTGGTDNGEFSGKVVVNGQGPNAASGGPHSYSTLNAYASSTTNGVHLALPARAVVFMVVDKK